MELPSNVTLNQNTADCIRATYNIGSTTYANICNGVTSVVPWGSLDWIAAVFMGLILLGFLAGAVWLVRHLNV